MKSFFLLVFLFIYHLTFAQLDSSSTDNRFQKSDSTVQLNFFKKEKSTFLKKEKVQNGILIEKKDERIDLLIQDYMDNKSTMGYRVQLFSGNSRWEAVKVKSDFLKKYKNEKAPHLVYQSPNFKIRVGDYRDRLEAQKYLELYKVDYPSAFVVKDEIEIGLSD